MQNNVQFSASRPCKTLGHKTVVGDYGFEFF